MGFWGTSYNRAGPRRIRYKNFGLHYMCLVFIAPTIFVYVGNHPNVQLWWFDYNSHLKSFNPPEAHPSIIKDIFHGREPTHSSEESYDTERRLTEDRMRAGEKF